MPAAVVQVFPKSIPQETYGARLSHTLGQGETLESSS